MPSYKGEMQKSLEEFRNHMLDHDRPHSQAAKEAISRANFVAQRCHRDTDMWDKFINRKQASPPKKIPDDWSENIREFTVQLMNFLDWLNEEGITTKSGNPHGITKGERRALKKKIQNTIGFDDEHGL